MNVAPIGILFWRHIATVKCGSSLNRQTKRMDHHRVCLRYARQLSTQSNFRV